MMPQISVCLVPEAPYPAFVSRAQRLEEAGCAHIWVYSNVLWRQRPAVDVAGALSAVSAILGATRTVHAGLMVASPNLYHPVVVAKEILTLDALSGGRAEIVLGSGSTGSGDPSTDGGILAGRLLSAGERAEIFEEFVRAFRHAVEFSRSPSKGGWIGKHYSVNLHRLSPGAREDFVLGVAANGRRSMQLAANAARRWVTSLPLNDNGDADMARLSALSQAFDTAYAREYPAAPIVRSVFVPLDSACQRSLTAWREFLAAVAGLGFGEVIVHHPRPHDRELPGPSGEVFAAAFPGLSGAYDG